MQGPGTSWLGGVPCAGPHDPGTHPTEAAGGARYHPTMAGCWTPSAAHMRAGTIPSRTANTKCHRGGCPCIPPALLTPTLRPHVRIHLSHSPLPPNFEPLSQLSSPPPTCQTEKLLVSFLFNVISTGVAMETRHGVGGLNCLQAACRHWSQGRGPEPGELGQAGGQAVQEAECGALPCSPGGPLQLQCHRHMSPCSAPCSRPCAGPP